MKTHYPRLSRIVLKDWLEYHPYDREVTSDQFYIGLSNKIQHEMLLIDVEDHLVGADYKCMAYMLACYLEDTVSQTGMWTSFVDEHRKLYGRYLPFYDLAGYEYGNINLADIQFLIWHFCSNLLTQNRFVDPYSIGHAEIAKFVYALLKESEAQAPKNDDLKAALTLPPDADIHKVAEHLKFVFFGCYLHQYYFASLMAEEILDVKNQKGSHKNFDQLLDERRTGLLFRRVTPLLAQRSSEMLAHWAGREHPLYEKLMSMSKRHEGLFLYEGEYDGHLRVKHLATGLFFELHCPAWDFSLIEGVTVVQAGIVQWDDEWYAIGPAFPQTNETKVSIPEHEKHLFASPATHLGIVKREEECFLEINYNKRIAILESKLNTFVFIDKVWDLYHIKYGTEIKNRRAYDVHDLTFNVDDDIDNLVVFFNPRSGMEFFPNIAQCISIWDNTFFNKNAETNIEDLIMDERVSSDFVSLLLNNDMVNIEPVSGKSGFPYVRTNCDFLLRYWKKERYVSEPKLFIE